MSGREMQTIDQRVRMALRGTETHRAVVDSVHGPTCIVRLQGGLLPALVAGHTVVAGSVVEVARPRGVGGQLQVVRTLG